MYYINILNLDYTTAKKMNSQNLRATLFKRYLNQKPRKNIFQPQTTKKTALKLLLQSKQTRGFTTKASQQF
jgi:hypothetical protein